MSNVVRGSGGKGRVLTADGGLRLMVTSDLARCVNTEAL
jgi:hypothetical protein